MHPFPYCFIPVTCDSQQTTPHQRMHNLSQHVHRIGYHFPSMVVATACMELGLYLTATGKAMPIGDLRNNRSFRRAESEVSQTTINTEARDVIRDLFPNILDKDLNQIIKTAFQKVRGPYEDCLLLTSYRVNGKLELRSSFHLRVEHS
jgi:hypothetical protein